MSTVAGGTFLPGCAGLVTVVEKNSRDLTIDWTNQQRESITFKAQHNLRLLSFRKIHLVLGVELLPKKPTKTNEVKVWHTYSIFYKEFHFRLRQLHNQ